MQQPLKRSVIVLCVLLALLTLSWIGAALRNWADITASPERLSQLFSDVPFIVLPGVLGVLGLWARKPWGAALFSAGLGALLYGTARTVALLYWDNYFHVPWIGALLLLVALLGYVVYALRAVSAEPGDGS